MGLTPTNWLYKRVTLYLHIVLYAIQVGRNLISIIILLILGFKIIFEKSVKILLNNINYDFQFIWNDFIGSHHFYLYNYINFAISSSNGDSLVQDIEQNHFKRLSKIDLLGSIENSNSNGDSLYHNIK